MALEFHSCWTFNLPTISTISLQTKSHVSPASAQIELRSYPITSCYFISVFTLINGSWTFEIKLLFPPPPNFTDTWQFALALLHNLIKNDDGNRRNGDLTCCRNKNYSRASLSVRTLLMRRNNRKVNSVPPSFTTLAPWLSCWSSWPDTFACSSVRIGWNLDAIFRATSLLWVMSGARPLESQLAESCRDLLQLVVLRRFLPVFRCVSCDVIPTLSSRSQLLNPPF